MFIRWIGGRLCAQSRSSHDHLCFYFHVLLEPQDSFQSLLQSCRADLIWSCTASMKLPSRGVCLFDVSPSARASTDYWRKRARWLQYKARPTVAQLAHARTHARTLSHTPTRTPFCKHPSSRPRNKMLDTKARLTPIMPRGGVINVRKCAKCAKPHDGKYGSGRFCTVHCARAVGGNASRASKVKAGKTTRKVVGKSNKMAVSALLN